MQEDGWFSHDRAARRDPKILLMRSKYGAEGYGLYWMLIETLRETKNYKYPKKHLPALCLDFANELISTFIRDCIDEYELLSESEEFIWSDSLLRRMKKYEELCEKRAEAGQKGGKSKASAKLMLSDKIRLDKTREDKKEKKEKHGEKVSLSSDEYEKLCFQYGKKSVDSKIDDINNYCLSKGKSYKDYAATVRAWFKKDGVIPKNNVKRCPQGHFYTGDVCERCI